MAQRLKAHFGDQCVVLGLDDFYLTKAERLPLAEDQSPLFEIRGPPGTHDIALLTKTLDALLAEGSFSAISIPVFDKVQDDRKPEADWQVVKIKPRLIIIEGWCVGAMAPTRFAAGPSLNEAEQEDSTKAWRRLQVKMLKTSYAALWNCIDLFFHFDAPELEAVAEWRLQQRLKDFGIPSDTASECHAAWVADFIQYYERLTKAMAEGHRRPGTVIQLDRDRRVVSVKRKAMTADRSED